MTPTAEILAPEAPRADAPAPRHRDPRALVRWSEEARHLNADDDDPWFERHELFAMAACIAIGALFGVGVHFLPVVAAWWVG